MGLQALVAARTRSNSGIARNRIGLICLLGSESGFSNSVKVPYDPRHEGAAGFWRLSDK